MPNNIFKIYIHRNKTNNKVYIGQTCQALEKRWGKGSGYIHNPYFYSAINKYGWDNFEHIVWADNLTQDEANFIEKRLIVLFNTTDRRFGYNCRSGGDNSKHSQESIEKMRRVKKGHPVSEECKQRIGRANSKSVNQYTKDGDFVARHESMTQAEVKTGIKFQSISQCCRGIIKTAGGYKWFFTDDQNQPDQTNFFSK